MAAMQTASEFYWHHRGDVDLGVTIGDRQEIERIESRDAEVRAQALDDAAKAVCPWCCDGKTPERVTSRDGYTWIHKFWDDDACVGTNEECPAAAIHALEEKG